MKKLYLLFLIPLFFVSFKSIACEPLQIINDIKNIEQLKKSKIIDVDQYFDLLDKTIINSEDNNKEIQFFFENYNSILSLFKSDILNKEQKLLNIEKLIEDLVYFPLCDDNNVNGADTKQLEKEAAAKKAQEEAAAKKAQEEAAAAVEAAKKAQEDAEAALEAAKKAQQDINTNKNITVDTSNLEKIDIGKVLKVKKGKGLADGQKLKKRNRVETNTVYTTLAGGDLAFILDEKTRIFMGNDSELIIKSFLIPEKKSHEVYIELIKGSFLYQSLRKTNTSLIVKVNNMANMFRSNGFETSVAFNFRENENDIRFVNAGESILQFLDKDLLLGDYGVIDQNGTLSLNNIPNKYEDSLIGLALEDFSMTIMGMPTQTPSGGGGTDGGGSDGDGGGAGGCG
jgi:hypothetical protein